MTKEFKLNNCILFAMLVLVICTYCVMIQNIKNDVQINHSYEIKTVAAFNA